MRPKFVKTTLIIATLINLLSQVITFVPAGFKIILQQLPGWNNIIIGTSLFGISLFAYIFILRSVASGFRPNWILFIILIVAPAGIFFLQDGLASNVGLAGFLFSGTITT